MEQLQRVFILIHGLKPLRGLIDQHGLVFVPGFTEGWRMPGNHWSIKKLPNTFTWEEMFMKHGKFYERFNHSWLYMQVH